MYRLETALIKLASCPLLTSWYASRETIEIEQWSLFEAWADFGRTFLEADMISVQVRTYLTRYIATLGDPHHSRNVFTHYILEAMQLVIYKSWDPHTLYISLESVLKKNLLASITMEQNLLEFSFQASCSKLKKILYYISIVK